jgi:pimeloyl-ACP methyl ester carboxylesterase
MELLKRQVSANGLSFETFECGVGDRLALCLHGFPSHAICWDAQLPMLAKLGYRAWSPNQRGYGRSSRPRGVAAYAIDRLLEDIAAIIDASAAKSTVLIGHDWGGLLAWFVAARRVRPLDALIILNAPHPACAAVAFRRWRQLRKGWYLAAFQIPFLPDACLRFNRAWLVGRLMAAVAGPRAVFSAERLEFYRTEAARPGAVTAMLNWYRGLFRGGVPPEMKSTFPLIEAPTLVIWGEGDAVLDPSCLEGLDRYVANLTVSRLPGVSHWVQEEAPEVVNEIVAGFLRKTLPAAPLPHAPF